MCVVGPPPYQRVSWLDVESLEDAKYLRLGLETFQVLYARLPRLLARFSGRQVAAWYSNAGGMLWEYVQLKVWQSWIDGS